MKCRGWAPIGLVALHVAFAGASTWAANTDRLSDVPDAVTCEYFNRAAGGAWINRGGDWVDAAGQPQGSKAYATAGVVGDPPRWAIQLDVTRLVDDWLSGRRNAEFGMMLRSVGPRHGISDIASRESLDPLRRPTLTLVYADGSRRLLDAAADSYLDCTTERGLGAEDRLKLGREYNALLRYDLPAEVRSKKLAKAWFAFVVAKQYGDSDVGVFAVSPPASPDIGPRIGLAAAYPGDAGIERHKDVWFATGFDGAVWQAAWSEYDPRSSTTTLERDDERKFVPLVGKALRVKIPQGKNLGMDLRYAFGKHGGEPDEAYFRYYLRFAEDWRPDVDGGKLPGFAGTYGRAGWGMRKTTGADGWSMRGSFFIQPSAPNPYRGHTTIGTYAYHIDSGEPSGEPWRWPLGRLAAFENNRWYSVEQYFKVNTPGRSDGVLRAWIDGRLVVERTGFRVRTVPDVRIETVWFNIYHGGIAVAPRDMHLYIDNVVIARSYIGPITNFK